MSLNEEMRSLECSLIQGEHLLFVSAYGMGKRTSLDEFNVQYRGGKELNAIKSRKRQAV